MKIASLGLAAAALILLAATSPARAQTAAQLSVKDATGTTRTLCETADGSGNLTPCLQSGAATSAGVAQVAANTKPPSSFGAVTVGTAFTPGVGIVAICTTSGNVVLAGADGTQITVPAGVGFNQFGFAVASVPSETATCTLTALR